jgi:formamidopyrimidine-DNA glycosylase
MPELPEVETVRAGLAASATGARVASLEVLDARSLKRHGGGFEDFRERIIGAEFEAVVRRGKFLWLPLTGQSDALVGHLGMSGQILIRTPDRPLEPQTRVVLGLESSAGPLQLRFIDQRIFGSLAIDPLVATRDGLAGGFAPEAPEVAARPLIPEPVAHIARDLLDEHFDSAGVARAMRKRSSGIKRVLLDQNLLSGIGNIYADESLWRARLHFDQPTDSISNKKLDELIEHAQQVLREAVVAGGTSFDEQYKNVNGESGYFSIDLRAYGQTDKPCARCAKPIRRVSWANRGSHFCPNCQRLKPARHRAAVAASR